MELAATTALEAQVELIKAAGWAGLLVLFPREGLLGLDLPRVARPPVQLLQAVLQAVPLALQVVPTTLPRVAMLQAVLQAVALGLRMFQWALLVLARALLLGGLFMVNEGSMANRGVSQSATFLLAVLSLEEERHRRRCTRGLIQC